jgi:hypothetical protein
MSCLPARDMPCGIDSDDSRDHSRHYGEDQFRHLHGIVNIKAKLWR